MQFENKKTFYFGYQSWPLYFQSPRFQGELRVFFSHSTQHFNGAKPFVYTHVTTTANITCSYLQKCSFEANAVTLSEGFLGGNVEQFLRMSNGLGSVDEFRRHLDPLQHPSPTLFASRRFLSQHVNLKSFNFLLRTNGFRYDKTKYHSRVDTPCRPWPILSLNFTFS